MVGCGPGHAKQGRPVYEYPGIVHAQFSAASGYSQGLTWTRNGRPAPRSEIASPAGASPCGWGTAVVLTVARAEPTITQSHQYVRDPDGAISKALSQRWQRQARLPSNARPTGYATTGPIELWLTPDESVAYLVSSADHGDVERWPISVPPVACTR